jgi:hypothetical protein
MPVKIKEATINSIEATETKKLKVLKITSKTEGASMTIELPDALCDPFSVKDSVAIIIDSEEITRGEKAKLYTEGTVFKMNESDGLEVVGTIGGLRFVLNLTSPKPTQRKTFDSEKVFVSLD